MKTTPQAKSHLGQYFTFQKLGETVKKVIANI